MHFDGQGFYAAHKDAVEGEGGDGDAEACDGGHEGFADPVGEHLGVSESLHCDGVEDGDHAEDGAEQADERADACNDFENDEAAVECTDFFASGGGHTFECVCAIAVTGVEDRFDDAREGSMGAP